MREGIGSIFLYNMMILFITIIFCFLAATVNYYKAFKVNSAIAKEIEEYEGYNLLSDTEIARVLSTLGYRQSTSSTDCPKKDGEDALALYAATSNYDICLYRFEESDYYYSYGIITYMYFDLPIIGENFKIQIYAKTESIYDFANGKSA